MGSLSDYKELIILDEIFSAQTYLSLSTANILDDASGNAEPTAAGNYGRVSIPAASMEDAAAGAIQNDTIIAFAESSAAWSTGASSLTHFGVWDAVSGGNLLLHGTLDTSRVVNAAGIVLRVPIGELDVTLD